jgi:lipoic acid synthetase
MRPPWLKVRLPGLGQYYSVRRELGALGVSTVCEAARCPNAAECWGGGTATFMILGEVCTRGCRFCAVASGRPAGPPAADEPARVAEAAARLGLRHVVVTSVDRDDLSDGGARHFALTVGALAECLPGALCELLTPDFGGDERALATVAGAGAAVLGHNLECVRALTPRVRDRRASYELSLAVLARYRALAPHAIVKSSLLLGLGESDAEVEESLRELRAVGVDWVTLGQYLRPTRRHAPVRRFVEPGTFAALGARARELGFALVSSGPLVRSSYRAAEHGARELLERRSLAGRSGAAAAGSAAELPRPSNPSGP